MRDWTSHTASVTRPPIRTTREAALRCVLAAFAFACSAGLCVAAVLGHPPVVIVPLLVIACVASPVFGTWELPHAVAVLRRKRETGKRRTIARCKQGLSQLPEVDHPLGR